MSEIETNPQVIAERINFPLEQWPGQCDGVVALILANGIVEGERRYGLWTGGAARGSKFAGRPFTGHGWIELPDGRVYDPTRWAFEMVAPYVYLGPNDYYDTTGDALREGMASPLPPYDPADRVVALDLPPEAVAFTLLLLGNPPAITNEHCWWLANCSRRQLGEHARPIFVALIAAGYREAIPYDNRAFFRLD